MTYPAASCCAAASVSIGDTAPELTSLSVSPTSPTVDSTLTASATGSDVDGDAVSFTYAWTVAGATVGTGSTLSGEFAKGGEIFNIVRRGVVEMGTISPGYILGEASTAGLALGVPGTFSEPWEFSHFLKTMGLEDMFNEDLAKHGVVSRARRGNRQQERDVFAGGQREDGRRIEQLQMCNATAAMSGGEQRQAERQGAGEVGAHITNNAPCPRTTSWHWQRNLAWMCR